jgi:hypothetical protein
MDRVLHLANHKAAHSIGDETVPIAYSFRRMKSRLRWASLARPFENARFYVLQQANPFRALCSCGSNDRLRAFMAFHGRHERRHHPRFAFSSEFKGKECSSTKMSSQSGKHFQGEIRDVSSGGIRLLTYHPIKASGVIQGEVVLPGMSIGVPSIMRVRWTRRKPSESCYHVGLQFLL